MPSRNDDQGNGTDEHRNGFGRRRNDRLVERVLPALIAALLVVLLVMAVVSGVVLHQNNEITANQKDIQDNQAEIESTQKLQAAVILGGCHRTQLIRDDLNVQAWVQYNVIKLSTEGPPPGQISEALNTLDPNTRAFFALLLASQSQARALYQHVLENTQYAPETDCESASKHPNYKFPVPVPFRLVAPCFDPTTTEGRRPEVPCRPQ